MNNKIILASLLLLSHYSLSNKKAHIALPDGYPGITGLFAFCPQTTKPLMELAQILLRGESTLSAAERELIAAYVSWLNKCEFCCNSHSAAALHLYGGDAALIEAVLKDIETAPISDKLKALLVIATQVQKSGKLVTAEHIAQARAQDATDLEIHHTVLIAAAFCLFNRYVDGLASETPTDPALYDAMGKQLAELGYIRNN